MIFGVAKRLALPAMLTIGAVIDLLNEHKHARGIVETPSDADVKLESTIKALYRIHGDIRTVSKALGD